MFTTGTHPFESQVNGYVDNPLSRGQKSSIEGVTKLCCKKKYLNFAPELISGLAARGRELSRDVWKSMVG